MINNLWIMKLAYDSELIGEYDLNPAELAVLIAISFHYNNDKGECFPSQELMAKRLNLSKRTMVRAVAILIDKKIIEKKVISRQNHYVFTKSFMKQLEVNSDNKVLKISDKFNDNAKKNKPPVVKKNTDKCQNVTKDSVKKSSSIVSECHPNKITEQDKSNKINLDMVSYKKTETPQPSSAQFSDQEIKKNKEESLKLVAKKLLDKNKH